MPKLDGHSGTYTLLGLSESNGLGDFRALSLNCPRYF